MNSSRFESAALGAGHQIGNAFEPRQIFLLNDHAEAVFRYEPAVAFKGTKPADITKRFDEMIRNATRSTLGIAPLITTSREKLTRLEIPAAGCDCKACCLAAYESIYKIDGVAQATVSFKESRITALIDPDKTGHTVLEEALKKRGVELPAKK